MRDFSDNKYISAIDKNSFGLLYFDGVLPRRSITHNELLGYIRNILAQLHFCVHLNGYKFLARLVELYITDDGYDQATAVEYLAEVFGQTPSGITANIETAIEHNKDFANTLSKIFGISNIVITDIADTVEAIGAVFYAYFAPVTEINIDAHTEKSNIDIDKVIYYVQHTEK